MKNILVDYVSEPLFELKCILDGDFVLTIKWNVFYDKKCKNTVIRARYILLDKLNHRVSLKRLNIRADVRFKQIELTDDMINLLQNMVNKDEQDVLDYVEVFMSVMFMEWLKTDFVDMVNSGDYKLLYFDKPLI